MSAAKAAETRTNWNLAGSSWAGAWKVFAGVGVVGLLGAGFGYTVDPRRFAFSWLTAFITILTITLGAIFFVLIQRLTSAGWSVTVRRTAEFMGLGVIALIPLFVPVLLTMGHLFPWLHGHAAQPGGAESSHASIQLISPAYAQEPNKDPHPTMGGTHGNTPPADHPGDITGHVPGSAAGVPGASEPHPTDNHGALATGAHSKGGHEAFGPMGDPHERIEREIIQKKSPYLNRTFFLVRVAIYFVLWTWIALRLFNLSQKQDGSKDPKLTLKAQAFSPPAAMLYALTLTFASFDWIMSLEPTWFSTIFGVIIFASGVVSSLALMILVTLALRASGPLKGAVTVEHFHDLGKLMFGFLVFWAYVQFSQFMLIWYASLPEETTFFHNRWDWAPWANVSMAILIFHFVLPFFWVMSRNFKRNLGRLRIGAAVILVMHVVDIYWYVMPNYLLGKPGFSFHWMDLACLLAVAGLWGAFVFNRMTAYSLVPVGDPRLERALHFQNA